jgi:3'(2'), 5'-bisphosphate nucleotidase
MPVDLISEKKLAVECVRRAAELTESVRLQNVSGLIKQDRSPVTIADFSSQALIARMLADEFPGDMLVAEENSSYLVKPEAGDSLRRVVGCVARFISGAGERDVLEWIDRGRGDALAPRFWTLDPVDGTKGFLRNDQYAVALSLVIEGRVVLSALAAPNLKNGLDRDIGGEGTLALAVRGEGFFVAPLKKNIPPDGPDFRPFKVSRQQDLFRARLLRSFENSHTDAPLMDRIASGLGIISPPILMDSLAKYIFLACGGAELLIRFPTRDHRHDWIWDQAPGALLIEEAGGRVTDLTGKPLDFTRGVSLTANTGFVASNGWVHDAAIAGIGKEYPRA